MKVKTASGYDTLYPKTTAAQVITDSSKRFTSDTEMNEKQAASITLADNAGSTTLPAVASGTIPSKIQALRDNIKALFSYFSNGIANKATQDSAGQQISTTYIKGLSVSGKTVTYTKGDGSTGTITTQDTVNTYTLPTANASALGGVKLSDSTSLTSGVSEGVAATPTAVKAAYDLANTANTAASSTKTTVDKLSSASAYIGQTWEISSSKTWAVPYDGKYKITTQSAGSGGRYSSNSQAAGVGGNGGAMTIAVYSLTKDSQYTITIGAAGAAGTSTNSSTAGGGTTINIPTTLRLSTRYIDGQPGVGGGFNVGSGVWLTISQGGDSYFGYGGLRMGNDITRSASGYGAGGAASNAGTAGYCVIEFLGA